uniref:Uncharacterized protein n=1 Tax=Wuchereria bancrofti TaxID=6293 RepID=A0AAF5PK34_WUCBA
MGSSTVSGITSLSLYWFISTIIIWICKKGTRRKERLESLAHRGKMDKLEQLRRLRDDEEYSYHSFGTTFLEWVLEEKIKFDALYAQERKERSEREQSRRKRYKRPNKQELKDVKHVDAKSIRDVLRKRLKGEEINSLYQRQNDIASYQSDKKMKKEASKTKSFRAKLRELSMSPRTRRKVELVFATELSYVHEGNLKNFNKALTHKNKPSSSEKLKIGTESIKESPSSWLFKSAKKLSKKEWFQQQLDLR